MGVEHNALYIKGSYV